VPRPQEGSRAPSRTRLSERWCHRQRGAQLRRISCAAALGTCCRPAARAAAWVSTVSSSGRTCMLQRPFRRCTRARVWARRRRPRPARPPRRSALECKTRPRWRPLHQAPDRPCPPPRPRLLWQPAPRERCWVGRAQRRCRCRFTRERPTTRRQLLRAAPPAQLSSLKLPMQMPTAAPAAAVAWTTCTSRCIRSRAGGTVACASATCAAAATTAA